MKKIKRIDDFIKSIFYYPKMKRYLKERCGIVYTVSMLEYAKWHCKAGKLK